MAGTWLHTVLQFIYSEDFTQQLDACKAIISGPPEPLVLDDSDLAAALIELATTHHPLDKLLPRINEIKRKTACAELRVGASRALDILEGRSRAPRQRHCFCQDCSNKVPEGQGLVCRVCHVAIFCSPRCKSAAKLGDHASCYLNRVCGGDAYPADVRQYLVAVLAFGRHWLHRLRALQQLARHMGVRCERPGKETDYPVEAAEARSLAACGLAPALAAFLREVREPASRPWPSEWVDGDDPMRPWGLAAAALRAAKLVKLLTSPKPAELPFEWGSQELQRACAALTTHGSDALAGLVELGVNAAAWFPSCGRPVLPEALAALHLAACRAPHEGLKAAAAEAVGGVRPRGLRALLRGARAAGRGRGGDGSKWEVALHCLFKLLALAPPSRALDDALSHQPAHLLKWLEGLACPPGPGPAPSPGAALLLDSVGAWLGGCAARGGRARQLAESCVQLLLRCCRRRGAAVDGVLGCLARVAAGGGGLITASHLLALEAAMTLEERGEDKPSSAAAAAAPSPGRLLPSAVGLLRAWLAAHGAPPAGRGTAPPASGRGGARSGVPDISLRALYDAVRWRLWASVAHLELQLHAGPGAKAALCYRGSAEVAALLEVARGVVERVQGSGLSAPAAADLAGQLRALMAVVRCLFLRDAAAATHAAATLAAVCRAVPPAAAGRGGAAGGAGIKDVALLSMVLVKEQRTVVLAAGQSGGGPASPAAGRGGAKGGGVKAAATGDKQQASQYGYEMAAGVERLAALATDPRVAMDDAAGPGARLGGAELQELQLAALRAVIALLASSTFLGFSRRLLAHGGRLMAAAQACHLGPTPAARGVTLGPAMACAVHLATGRWLEAREKEQGQGAARGGGGGSGGGGTGGEVNRGLRGAVEAVEAYFFLPGAIAVIVPDEAAALVQLRAADPLLYDVLAAAAPPESLVPFGGGGSAALASRATQLREWLGQCGPPAEGEEGAGGGNVVIVSQQVARGGGGAASGAGAAPPPPRDRRKGNAAEGSPSPSPSGSASAAAGGEESVGEEAGEAAEGEAAVVKECAACGVRGGGGGGAEGPKLRKCAGCLAVRYCSAACQRAHWQGGHKSQCAAMAAARRG